MHSMHKGPPKVFGIFRDDEMLGLAYSEIRSMVKIEGIKKSKRKDAR